MRVLMEEQGALIISAIIGSGLIVVGSQLFQKLQPLIEVFLFSIM
ncbi:MAG: hypothetical protein R3Y58_11875 [Eubacteriales bacterium]